MNGSEHIAPWLGIGVVSTSFAVLVGFLQALRLAAKISAEALRKLFHLGGGAIALALPWLFDAVWPVVALGVASIAVFAAMRLAPILRDGFGEVLNAVPRQTTGEFWFLVGVFAVYIIAGADLLVYSVAIIVLAVADTAAALIGILYGKYKFDVPGATKTAEGSFAFLLTAFLSVHVPVLLFSATGRPESLLISINIALLAMLAEAVAARGLDNLVLPVVVAVLFDAYLQMDVLTLVTHCAIIVGLGLFVAVYKNHTTLSADALIGAVLAGYVFWSIGGWRWMVAPVVLFSTYTWLAGKPPMLKYRRFHLGVLFAIVAPSLALATAYWVTGQQSLYLPYVAMWCANLAIIGTLHGQIVAPNRSVSRLVGLNTLKSLVVMIPGLAVGGHYQAPGMAATLLSVPLALGLFALIGGALKFEPTRPAAWSRVSASVGGGALISFGMLGLIGGFP